MTSGRNNPIDQKLYSFRDIDNIFRKTKGHNVKFCPVTPLAGPGKSPEELLPYIKITQEIEETRNVTENDGKTRTETTTKELIIYKFIKLNTQDGKEDYIKVFEDPSVNNNSTNTANHMPDSLSPEAQATLNQKKETEAINQRNQFTFLPPHLNQEKQAAKLKEEQKKINDYYQQQQQEEENKNKENVTQTSNTNAAPVNSKKTISKESINKENKENKENIESETTNVNQNTTYSIPMYANDINKEKNDKEVEILPISNEINISASSSDQDKEENKSFFDKFWEFVFETYFSFKALFKAVKPVSGQSTISENNVTGYQSAPQNTYSFLYQDPGLLPTHIESTNEKDKKGTTKIHPECAYNYHVSSIDSTMNRHYGIKTNSYVENKQRKYPQGMDLQRTIKFEPFKF